MLSYPSLKLYPSNITTADDVLHMMAVAWYDDGFCAYDVSHINCLICR